MSKQPLKPDPQSQVQAEGAGRWLAGLWRRVQDFSGMTGEATYLWPRWLVLRAVGVVFIFMFAGIVDEGRALLGPHGLVPLDGYFGQIKDTLHGPLENIFLAPTLFWFNTSATMITALAWLGIAAAVALVLNLWPRMALFVCWLVFLSFVTTWGEFSPTQIDNMMLETALLCIPFAPPGFRPGLGARFPPRPIAVLAMRWLLFRGMFESGVVKLISDDPLWRNFTAMDIMYETSPAPTIFGYWAFQLPHAYHFFEVALTFAAELLAPLQALLGGRRGRWWALFWWTALQGGIELTANFGWINLGALGLGLLLLDDQMVYALFDKLGRKSTGAWLAERAGAEPSSAPGPWRLYGLRIALGLHFGVTLYYFAKVCRVPVENFPAMMTTPVKLLSGLQSANRYYLFEHLHPEHKQIDFEGSNDGGKTWRTYETRHLPQREDQFPAFIAPWFPRFENTIFFESSRSGTTSVVSVVATHLLRRNPEVIARFRRDPFPDRPPTVMRMRRYRLFLTDAETHRRTGHYWRKELVGDYLPPFYLTAQGEVAQFSLADVEAAMAAGNYGAAMAVLERQYELGNLEAGLRLADMYARGQGVVAQPAKVFALTTEVAERGELRGLHGLGLCYEFGVGVTVDYAKAAALYRRAAAGGYLRSMFSLGALSAQARLGPKDDIEGLAWLLTALHRATSEDAAARLIREQQPALAQRLMARMSAEDVAQAKARAALRR